MIKAQQEKEQFALAYHLAAELTQQNVDTSLIQTAAAYMRAYPEDNIHDWLRRLARLGDLFEQSNQTGLHRHHLMDACKRLRPQPKSGQEWAWVLAWTARLYDYYKTNSREARQIIDVRTLQLSEPLPIYQPPPPPVKIMPPKHIEEPVSEKAQDFHKQLQAFWERRDKEGGNK